MVDEGDFPTEDMIDAGLKAAKDMHRDPRHREVIGSPSLETVCSDDEEKSGFDVDSRFYEPFVYWASECAYSNKGEGFSEFEVDGVKCKYTYKRVDGLRVVLGWRAEAEFSHEDGPRERYTLDFGNVPDNWAIFAQELNKAIFDYIRRGGIATEKGEFVLKTSDISSGVLKSGFEFEYDNCKVNVQVEYPLVPGEEITRID